MTAAGPRDYHESMRSLGLVAFVALAACSSHGPGAADGGSATGGSSASGGLGGGGTTGGSSGVSGTLAVSPASATLQVTLPGPATTQLQALVGATPVGAAWSSSRSDIAAVDQNGLVTAQGPRGGLVTVTATWEGRSASAQVTVVVNQLVLAGVGPSATQLFNGTPSQGSASAPAFLYPYDQTVIPVNLQPLDFQWQGGADNDIYRLTLAGPLATLTAYVTPASPAQPDYAFDPSVWQPFAQSNVGQTVTVDLAAAASGSPGPVYGAPTQKLALAASRFAGTIYYWTVSAPGQVLRISAGSTAPQSFYTPPFAPSASDGPSTDNCMACHAVSRDGTRMAAELWNGAAPGSGTILDLTQSPAVPVLPGGSQTWMFSTFDATGKLLLTSLGGQLTLRDAASGAPTAANGGDMGAIGCGPGGLCTQPAWSPDDATVVWTQGVSGAFSSDVSFSQTDLMSAGWDGGAFGAPSLLVAHDFDGQPLANFYPSISVDSRWLAFTRSSCSYNCNTNDGLFMVPLGGGAPVELATAEGSDKRNRYPNFSPFQEGGYQWLAFFSMRDYGWVTKGQSQRQIWVTAIDQSPTAGQDPSHPAFWLPAQDPTTMNDKAQWAALPCVGQGQGCQGDIDCCAGLLCRYVDGGSSCLPASEACGFSGSACSTSADCCSPLTCLAGSCGSGFH